MVATNALASTAGVVYELVFLILTEFTFYALSGKA